MSTEESYSDLDPREHPLYTKMDAARYLGIPVATVRSWIVGRSYPRKTGEGFFEPIIRLPEDGDGLLSFTNLVELHVLRSLRVDHVVPLRQVRAALTYAEETLALDRLLIRQDLKTAAGSLFLERFGQLINLSQSGQLAMKRVLEEHLQRVDWDISDLPVRLFPFVSHGTFGPGVPDRPVVIDPRVSFGRPVLTDVGVSTGAIVRRIDAGERVDDIARDYEVAPLLIELAVVFEKAA